MNSHSSIRESKSFSIDHILHEGKTSSTLPDRVSKFCAPPSHPMDPSSRIPFHPPFPDSIADPYYSAASWSLNHLWNSPPLSFPMEWYHRSSPWNLPWTSLGYRDTHSNVMPYRPSLLMNASSMRMNRRHSRKGGQIRFTHDQSSELEKTFTRQRYLTPTQRKNLANKLNLSERQVKTWFQNRRAKWRRSKQDGKPDHSNADIEPSDEDDNDSKEKDTEAEELLDI